MKCHLILAVCLVPFSLLSGTTSYSHGNPSDLEQYLLELINRARANPAAEESRQGEALNNDLTAGTISYSPKQPLAFDSDLIGAAGGHSNAMRTGNFFAHTDPNTGLEPCARALNAGYSTAVAENIAFYSSTAGLKTDKWVAETLFDALYDSEGHRTNTFREEAEQIGLGFKIGVAASSELDRWDLTEKFGGAEGFSGYTFSCDTNNDGTFENYPYEDQGQFLLGVCYSDLNGSGFYDPGEGVSGVTIEVAEAGFHAVTSSSGGYALPIPASGLITITAVGPGFNHTVTESLYGLNAKVDFLPGSSGGAPPMRDFDGDGKNDILWRHTTNYRGYLWYMDDDTLLSHEYTGPIVAPHWKIASVGDFAGDGQGDILWRHSVNGLTAIHYMNGGALVAGGYTSQHVGNNWEVVTSGDFDGNGKSDILWRRVTDGATAIHFMNGLTVTSAVFTSQHVSSFGWKIVGAADFDGDGKSDILWRRVSDGAMNVHLMDGSTYRSSGYVTLVTGNHWDVIGADDMDGDGKADILFRRPTTGQLAVHRMNHLTVTSTDYIAVVGLHWTPYFR